MTESILEGYESISVLGEQLWLLPQKAIFWPARKTLFVSDIHLGKTNHFRKAGIAMPLAIHESDLNRLKWLIEATETQQCLILGDLFHSDLNGEWGLFEEWLETLAGVEFKLVPGNHDILPDYAYQRAGIEVTPPIYAVGPFAFVHDPADAPEARRQTGCAMVFSGHVHPAFRLYGKARQSIRFPCFYFSDGLTILPSFGSFTGSHTVRTSKRDRVFLCVENEVLAV